MTQHSLKKSLLLWLLLPWCALLLFASNKAYERAVAIADTVYDRALYDSVLTLGILVHADQSGLHVDLPPIARRMIEVDPMDQIYFAVRTQPDKLLSGNNHLRLPANLPKEPMQPMFFNATMYGKPIRVAAARLISSGPNHPPVWVEVAETLKKRRTMAREILQQSIMPLLMFWIISLVLVIYAVRRALAPLHQLSLHVRQRSMGDFSPLPTHVPREVLPLATALNDLMQRQSEHLSAQQRFIAHAAHQLRTPVAGLRSLVEAELMDYQDQPAPDLLRQMHRVTLRMSRLVRQLLSLSRADPLNMMPSATANDLQLLIHEALSSVQQALPEHQHRILLQTSTEVLWVKGDHVLLVEMISNLIDNALRYSPANSVVNINQKQYRLSIMDHGPGVPESEMDQIFDPFFRGQHRQSEGSGLGLTIVREIIQTHQMRISVASSYPPPGLYLEVEFLAAQN